jgi:hypothetical protein
MKNVLNPCQAYGSVALFGVFEAEGAGHRVAEDPGIERKASTPCLIASTSTSRRHEVKDLVAFCHFNTNVRVIRRR